MAFSVCPLPDFMVKLCSHRPGFMLCALAFMQAKARGAAARARSRFMVESPKKVILHRWTTGASPVRPGAMDPAHSGSRVVAFTSSITA